MSVNIDELTGLAVIAQDRGRPIEERQAAFRECVRDDGVPVEVELDLEDDA